MRFSEAHRSWKGFRKYAGKAALGDLLVDLVPLEERHRRQMEHFQDRLDTETVYLRHGAFICAETRKSTAWLQKQWNNDMEDGFHQGAFLNSCLIGIGSILKIPGEGSAEAALVIAPDFQGLGRGGGKGIGVLLGEDLIRYARDQNLARVTAYLPVRNPRCEKLLRKFGFKMSGACYLSEDVSAAHSICVNQRKC